MRTIFLHSVSINRIFVVFLCLLYSGIALSQTTYYVKHTATGNNDGTSWTNAFSSLQDAITTAASGDQIWVAAGTYYPDEGTGLTDNDRSLSFNLKTGVAIYGGFAGTETQLDQRNWQTNVTTLSGDLQQNTNSDDNAYHVVIADGVTSTAILDGFTIKGGNAIGGTPSNNGGGMLNSNGAAPTISNCNFTQNTGTFYGGGMYNDNASPILTNCSFTGNTAVANGGGMANYSASPTLTNCSFSGNATSNGGAIFNEGASPTIVNCSFSQNTATAIGGAIYNVGSSASLTNCIFSRNSASNAGGGIFNSGSPILTNCSFSGNTAPEGTGGGIYNSSSLTLINCILWGDTGGEIDNADGTSDVTYSIVQGGFTGTGNVSQNPLFVDAESDNLRLQQCSPAIDAGLNDANSTSTDLDGNSRISNNTIDMGAYEYQLSGAPTIIYVKSNAAGSNDGTSWANAYKKLQDALSRASTCRSNAQIWVAAGTYYPDEGNGLTDNDRSLSFNLKTGVAIYGGFAGTETQLDQRNWQTNVTTLSGDLQQNTNSDDNAYHVVIADGVTSTAILDGFTIKGGNAIGGTPSNNGGGMLNSNGAAPNISNCSFTENRGTFYGGGMYNDNASPILTNCSFTGNTAVANGGGMANYSASPTLTNCSFSGNATSNGGAIFNEGASPTIVNCSFSQNTATAIGGAIYNVGSSASLTNCIFSRNSASNAGGGIFNSGSPILTNCSFSGNTAPEGTGGGIYNSSSLTLINCILWGDTGGEIDNLGAADVTYSIVQGGSFTGNGNLNKDPLFVNAINDDLHLQPCSPAVNAGLNSANSTSTDLDGHPRIFNNIIDMGAYESQTTACCPSGNVLFVKKDASGNNNGTSWQDAFTSLQDALAQTANCRNVTQIWVAAGIYYPDEGKGLADNNRSLSFNLKNGIAIYGGFAGTETQLGQRDWKNNITILSGDLMQNDGANFANNGDNAYRVVRSNSGINNTAILDGFTIKGGNANGGAFPDVDGGGMHIDGSSPTLSNCSFLGNTATFGGGIFTHYSSSTLTNCSFLGNSASSGGGVYMGASSPTLTNCSFSKNSATFGGGMNNDNASPTLTNCSFSGNMASNTGGAILNDFSSSPTVTNCILWGGRGGEISNNNSSTPVVTYSIVEGGYTGTGNKDQDPLFADAANGDLHLLACSPAIDAGNNTAVTTTTDLDGNTRIVNSTVDMGAYEFNGTPYTYYKDNDGDGYGSNISLTSFCSTPPSGYVSNNSDCDDNDANVHSPQSYYVDEDGDGYGSSVSGQFCSSTPPSGYSINTGDCNDSDPAINPATVWYKDVDKDGYSDGTILTQCTRPTNYKLASELTAISGDCSDNDPTVNPGAVEVCSNGKDDNCNGSVDEQPCYVCQNATGLTTTDITSTSAKLNWNAVANPVQWQVQYKTTNQGAKWKDVFLTGNIRSVTLSGLLSNQSYNWHIRGKCGKTWTNYSNAVMFKTLSGTSSVTIGSVSANEVSNSIVKLYPNPTKGQFIIELHVAEKINGNAKIQLIDITGKTVQTENAGFSNGALQKVISISSSLAKGMYMVRIIMNDKIFTTPLIYEK